VGQAFIELGSRDVDAVAVTHVTDLDVQRNDTDLVLGYIVRRQTGRTV
jgi:hypothetical protein